MQMSGFKNTALALMTMIKRIYGWIFDSKEAMRSFLQLSKQRTMSLYFQVPSWTVGKFSQTFAKILDHMALNTTALPELEDHISLQDVLISSSDPRNKREQILE